MAASTAGSPVASQETPPLTWVAFLLLCTLIASLWLLPSPLVRTADGPAGEAFLFALATLLAYLAGGRLRCSALTGWLTAGLGLLLFFVPSVLQQASTETRVNQIALFALVPAGVVMLMAFRSFGTLQGGNYLPAAIGGFGGLLLVLPIQVPSSGAEILRLLPILVATASISFGSARIHGLAQSLTSPSLLLLVALPNALLFLADAALTHDLVNLTGLLPGSLWGDLVALLQLCLLIWLLRSMDPRRLAVRFLLVPLLTTAEGMVALHDAPTTRIAAGILLSAASAAYLLRGSATDDTLPLTLR